MNLEVITGLWELASYWFLVYMASGNWWLDSYYNMQIKYGRL
jgi:hypothetical protein